MKCEDKGYGKIQNWISLVGGDSCRMGHIKYHFKVFWEDVLRANTWKRL